MSSRADAIYDPPRNLDFALDTRHKMLSHCSSHVQSTLNCALQPQGFEPVIIQRLQFLRTECHLWSTTAIIIDAVQPGRAMLKHR